MPAPMPVPVRDSNDCMTGKPTHNSHTPAPAGTAKPAQPPVVPTFVEDDYDAPIMGLEVQEESGAWRSVTIYTHATGENAVLWFGNGECEGIGDNYQYTQATDVKIKGHGAEEGLVDGDGCVINIRRPSAQAVAGGMHVLGSKDNTHSEASGRVGTPVTMYVHVPLSCHALIYEPLGHVRAHAPCLLCPWSRSVR